MEKTVKAIRGATTADSNTKESIVEATKELLSAIIENNSLVKDDLISIIFSATEDLTAEFPAVAARGIGLTDVPLLCCKELSIDGSLNKCIRILVHTYLKGQPKHVYMHEARKLREDLS